LGSIETREAEVHDREAKTGSRVLEHYVLGLDVAVNYPSRMYGGNASDGLAKDQDDFASRERCNFPQSGGESFTREQFHRKK
jgi:hypothetical protein